ncbi:peptide deformylase Def [Gottschalkia acidurici 9a]|uniref:Peptide deformylase n=1 Tax=Gottschalkia acidurici (strain ATCC 7906 / DSM 604 / BCRC 14475 / CIP 104303 / KCTC 5404 / NCIMB 10678 / 9a) TaxID=1128398 RepID=K0B0T4_GOTA9|nr:peptide deformylase [Gottschalkia acidurici]AFS78692.1 peptide deformylase Def [Gottschalkia acidurici 9a]
MAIRQLRFEDDEILRKKSRVVETIDEKIKILVEDMIETMYKEEGVGLAAPQVGILKRVVVVDIGEGPITMINPEILSEEGETIDFEGCLSVPGKRGKVNRPFKVKVKFTDINGEEKTLEGEDFLARAFCHEIDHLDGILYIDRVIGEIEE